MKKRGLTLKSHEKNSLQRNSKKAFAIVFILAVFCLTFGGKYWLEKGEAQENDSAAPSVQFCNTTPISITGSLSQGPASPYPSNITVSGLTGVVSNITVTLNSIQHNFGRDIDSLLVSPDGRKFVIMADVGQANGLDNPVTLTLSDSGAALISNQFAQIPSGVYKPTNYNDIGVNDTDFFNSPAPDGPHFQPPPTGSASFGSVFNGANPNGTWSLYVMDDASSNSGSIAGGWCLDITTAPPQNGQFQFGLSGYNANAGSTANVSVTRTNGTAGAVTINYAANGGTATGGSTCAAGVDYISPTGTLSFAAGETSKNFSVQLCPDSGNEPTETINLELSNPTGGATIGSPGNVNLTINPQSAPAASFCNAVPIEIAALGGTAGSANPYPSNITVTGMSGTVRDVSIRLNKIQHDSTSEIDMLLVSPTGQKFIVMSDVGSGLSLRTAQTLTLTDYALTNLPVSSIEIPSGNYKPTNSGANDGFPSPAPTSPHGNPVPAGTDSFASIFGGFDPNGVWQLFVYDDFVGFRGNISGGWCVDIATEVQQAPGRLQFGTTNYVVNEGETANLTVTRSGGSSGAVTVDFTTSNGSATGGATCGNGADFISASGTLSFPDGVSSQTIPVQMCLDAENDPEETFGISLSNPTGGSTIGANNSASVRISHIDQSNLSLASSRFYIREGKTVTIAVYRSSNQIGIVSVDYATSSGEATGSSACTDGVDFINESGTLVFQPGDFEQTFTIETCNDALDKEIENGNITLSNAVGAQLSPAVSGNSGNL